MTNNKQQMVVEWLIDRLEEKGEAWETPSIRNIQFNIDTGDYLGLKTEAKEMEKERMKKIWDEGVISATYGKPINFEQYYSENYETKTHIHTRPDQKHHDS